MSIVFYEKERLFKLDTPNTSYIMGIVDEENFLAHVYYGEKLADHRAGYLLRTQENPFVPSVNNRDRIAFLDSLPMEYATHGIGDCRESCISIRTMGGNTAISLSYVSHEVKRGKAPFGEILYGGGCLEKDVLGELPASFGQEGECGVLEVLCEDRVTGLQMILQYGVFEDVDVITRSIRVVNQGMEDIYLTKVYSACLDMDNRQFESVTLHGSWARERQIQSLPVSRMKHTVESLRGETSHQDHPFMALKTPGTTQETGEVYAMHFVYSGNFRVQVQEDPYEQIRMVMGINPEDFCWKLAPGTQFQAPEVVMAYSGEGLGKMTRTFHDFYRKHLIRGEYRDKKRPILINNWEATYFDFDADKLISIAREASGLGIEMLVMDDGWFGNRFDDNRALGDWVVNEEKLKGGLKYLVDEVNKLGMKFGIWFEPEMISPDSDLYRAHPDWAIAIGGRQPSLARNQYVLDLTRKEVRDHV